MQFFGRQNLPPSLLNPDQVYALRFSLLSMPEQKTVSPNGKLPTANAIGAIFGESKMNNGFRI